MEGIRKNPLSGERLMIPCRDCEIEVYWHKAKKENCPVLFEFHGGGLVLCDAAKDDNLREIIKNELDIHVVGVNYRKAPEYPHPAAVNDAFDVVQYFCNHAAEFDIDKSNMAVMGFSAGATLATVIAMQAVNTKAFPLKGQILHYPYVDGVSDPAGKKQHKADLPIEVMEAFCELYAGDCDSKDSYISPLYAKKQELENTAPAVLILAEEDALYAEGIAYGKKLLDANVLVSVFTSKEMHHGYMEDYFNQACYEMLPEDTKALHSKNMPIRAKESMDITIEALRKFFA